ncbi:molybdopterin-containing oxidoreductase family protein [Desulforhopalus singaporensis]|uniref:Anaerobic selenocysteine-containing dehydrogenase n=1 Tax=Desulforhopalus singaporensis TaxID=91360 RepID=A0A1H0RN46_9BACT|nr:molybdopterin-dependent oxidoreductase [Desulforhopalus singaporensis]SDP30932.1 Anaerobic selenocysteine-containing dehydrogenase [Desulforhopalus singaporensis]
MNKVVVPGVCGVCDAGCGVNVHIVDGRITRQTMLKGHPSNTLCHRGIHASEIIYSRDRLLYPQRRVGERGEGRFEQIGWDQAYEIWVDKLEEIKKEYGPEAVCMYTGRGNFEFGVQETFPPSGTSESSASSVLFPWGSPNTTGVGALCFVAYGMIAPQACYGGHYRNVEDDLDNADLILVWGANPATDSPPGKMKYIHKAARDGVRIVCIDHRRSETAKAVDGEWVGIRPGTDGALAHGIMHVLVNRNLYDKEFVAEWTHGFDELARYVQDFTPEKVEQITGVPAGCVVDLAESIGKSKGCSILMYTGLEYCNGGVQSIRAVLSIQALVGHIDVVGGKVFKMPNRVQHNRITTSPPENARKPIGYDEYPLYYQLRNEAHGVELPKAVLHNDPYPVRGLIVSGASLITSWADSELWKKTLAALDLVVVVNRFPTADAQYADLILPAATPYESTSYQMHDGWVQLRQQLIEPLGEARSDFSIFTGLAQRLGYGERWPGNDEQKIRHGLEGTGVTLEELRENPIGVRLHVPKMKYQKYKTGELRADGMPGFETPTGKFEFTSEWYRSHGYNPLPVYTEPEEGPVRAREKAKKYPLVLNSGARTQSAFRSQHLNIPSLIKMQEKPLVWIHPQDATERGIDEGDKVWVESPRGKVCFWARVTEDIVQGVVEVNMGGGGPLGPREWHRANVNTLTDAENRDPISGFPVYKALLCDVCKCVLTQ